MDWGLECYSMQRWEHILKAYVLTVSRHLLLWLIQWFRGGNLLLCTVLYIQYINYLLIELLHRHLTKIAICIQRNVHRLRNVPASSLQLPGWVKSNHWGNPVKELSELWKFRRLAAPTLPYHDHAICTVHTTLLWIHCAVFVLRFALGLGLSHVCSLVRGA